MKIDEVLINLALAEDLGSPWCDVTCEHLLSSHPAAREKIQASIISKHQEQIVLSGFDLVTQLNAKFSNEASVSACYQDGDLVPPGETLFVIEDTRANILMLERTLLNFLRHMCAVATLTQKFVDKISQFSTQVLDTRKTTPGFRLLDKYAVTCGGGVNHRMGLYDAIMIKDTHIDLLGGIEETLSNFHLSKSSKLPVVVEVRTLDELGVLLHHVDKVDRVLLDNMDLLTLKQCVSMCTDKLVTEASGNINLENVVPIAATGVDYVSVGAITHSAGNVDLSMKIC